MTFAQPLALLLLVPLFAAAVLLWLRADLLRAALPGHWDRVVDPGLRHYLARQVTAKGRTDLLLCLPILAILVLALARPGLDSGPAPDFGNLAGRVIVLDLGGELDIRDQRLFARQLIEAAPETPTAIVAVAGDAFDIVPLTRDRRQLSRYLAVLEPGHMPEAGRALHLGLAHAEATLARAGIAASQIVLVTGGPPPEDLATVAPSEALRSIAVPTLETEIWAAFAERQHAVLTGQDDLAVIVADLNRQVRDRLRDRKRGGQSDLTPGLIGLALLLWLALFRRRASA